VIVTTMYKIVTVHVEVMKLKMNVVYVVEKVSLKENVTAHIKKWIVKILAVVLKL